MNFSLIVILISIAKRNEPPAAPHQEIDGSHRATEVGAGHYAINAPGVWHTADVIGDEATAVFITAGHGTEQTNLIGAQLTAAVRRRDVGQVTPVAANIRDDASVAAAMAGSDAVINCVGTFQARGKNNMDAVQHEGAALSEDLVAARF